MRVELMTLWYNEEDLAPFFLKHYSWVDKINLIIDADTNDKTIEIASQYPNVEIQYFTFPDMMDDILKVEKVNQVYKTIDADWVILVDADEFIFTNDLQADIRSFLITDKNVLFSNLWNVYRHVSDSDLDINKTVMEQRRHGILNMHRQTATYIKPSIVRGKLESVEWTLGNHEVIINGDRYYWYSNRNQETSPLCGAHWAMADYDIAVKRRIFGRKLRQSKVNLMHGLTIQHHHITEEQIREECVLYQNSPQVF